MGIFTLAMHGALAEKRRERRARSEGATTAASGGGAGDGGETEAWRRCVRGQCGDGDSGHGIPPRPASPPLVEIHSFEPQKVLHMILGANVVLTNAWQEIFPHHLAISDHVGVLQANAADYSAPGRYAQMSFDPKYNSLRDNHRMYPVPATTLSELVAPTRNVDGTVPLPCPQLIKIDVEGLEMAVFRGARRLMQHCGPNGPTGRTAGGHSTNKRPWLYFENHETNPREM